MSLIKQSKITNDQAPRNFYRVTDDSSYVQIDECGNFATGCTPFYHLSYIINGKNLNLHLDWRYRFDNEDPNDCPMFISMTDSRKWAQEETERRLARGCTNVRLYRINSSSYALSHKDLGPSYPEISLLR